jgi:CubicO group peptidase (beta-lactamase class C family)
MSHRVAFGFVGGLLLGAGATAIAAPHPGCVERVIQAGTVVVDRSDGVRRLDARQPLDGSTRFRLASLSKQFTAAAILSLVEQGRLSLDDSLADRLPGLPSYTRTITVRHLLTHTAGLPDYEALMESPRYGRGRHYSPVQQISDREVLALLARTTEPDFVAGTRWAYSNSGYVVLGLLVEQVAGTSLAQYLQAQVFRPAGMTATQLHVPHADTVRARAYGHAVDSAGRFRLSDQSATSATGGDGGIYSTVDDLTRWLAALERGDAVPTHFPAAFTPVTLADGGATTWPTVPDEDNLDPGGPVSYGFGWFLDPAFGQPRRWHFGTTEGFRTAIEWFPRARVGSIVLCNRMDVDAKARALANARPYLTTAGPP